MRGDEKEEGEEEKKTCWHRLPDSQQISAIYRIVASNPKLSLTGSVGQGIYIEPAGSTSYRGSCFAADAGKINLLSLIFSYRHLFSSPPAQLSRHRWHIGRAGWLLDLANRRESSFHHPHFPLRLKTKRPQQQ